MGADEHTQEEVASTIEQYTAYAKENGYSIKEYLKMVFGSTMTVSTFKDRWRSWTMCPPTTPVSTIRGSDLHRQRPGELLQRQQVLLRRGQL